MSLRGRTAWTILNDSSRAYSFLNEHEPESVAGFERPRTFTFLDEIREFHDPSVKRQTRFARDYKIACRRLDDRMKYLEAWTPGLALFPSRVEPGKWHLNILRNWEPLEPYVMPETRHHDWALLHGLRSELSRQRDPYLQRTLLCHLPLSAKASVVLFLAADDVRTLAAVSTEFRGICSNTIDRQGKVTTWHYHAFVPYKELVAMRDEICAPNTMFGSALGALWAWFRERGRSGRSERTLSLLLLNRWGWAGTMTSEDRWLSMKSELSAWETCFFCGVLSLQLLRDLQLDRLAITGDMVATLAQHPTLRGLDLRGCGFPWPEETAVLPTLPLIRRLRLAWDPLSAFETTAAALFLSLTPNLVTLRLSNRRPDGPVALTLGNGWHGAPWCALRDIAVTGADVAFALAALANCRSRALHSVRLHVLLPCSAADIDSFLNEVAIRSSALETLVLDGCPRLSAGFLRALARSFPVLRDLALLPRRKNQRATGNGDWTLRTFEIASHLRLLADLERFCFNIPFAAGAVATACLDEWDRRSAGRKDLDCEIDDGLSDIAAAARPFGCLLTGIRSVAIATRGVVHEAHVHHMPGYPMYKSVLDRPQLPIRPRTAPYKVFFASHDGLMAPCQILMSGLPVNDDVLELILRYIRTGATLMRLRRVCKTLLRAVDDFTPRRFNIDKLLGRFVTGTDELRQSQAEIGAIFSGSQVMRFFEDCDWADASDFDIFLYPGTALLMGNHLIHNEGYTYMGDSWANDVANEPVGHGFSVYNMDYVRRVYKFEKGNKHIDLVACTDCPTQTILHFHCTPVVHGITWNKAFSCFAKGTYDDDLREGMVLDRWNVAVDKYRQRGFRIYDVRVGLGHQFHDHFKTGHRWIGDSDTWIIKLDVSRIAAPAVPDALEANSFTVTGVPAVTGPDVLNTTSYRIETVCFKHALVSLPCALSPMLWRFADTVINCVRRRWVNSGLPFTARVTIGRDLSLFETVFSWDRLFFLACTAWRNGRLLTAVVHGESASFYPLGGMVASRGFLAPAAERDW